MIKDDDDDEWGNALLGQHLKYRKQTKANKPILINTKLFYNMFYMSAY